MNKTLIVITALLLIVLTATAMAGSVFAETIAYHDYTYDSATHHHHDSSPKGITSGGKLSKGEAGVQPAI